MLKGFSYIQVHPSINLLSLSFIQHLQVDDPDYFRSTFETVLQNDVSDMNLEFAIREVDLKGDVKVQNVINF